MKINVIASGSGGNCTIISDGKTSLLLDAGITIKNIRAGSGFASVDGVLVTHEHQDHSKAVKALAKYGVDIYASQGTLDALNLCGHRYHALKALDWVTVGTFKAMPFDVTHDAEEPFGFYCESCETGETALYFSDTAYVKYTFDRVTYLIAECNHGKRELRQSVRDGIIDADLAIRIVKNHMSIERLIDFIKANGGAKFKAVHLVHLSGNNSDAERFKRTVQRETGAEVYVH